MSNHIPDTGKMVLHCEPPEEYRARSGYHWLRRSDTEGRTPPVIWTWRMPEAVWRASGNERKPEEMHHIWVAAVAAIEEVDALRYALDALVMACELPGDHCEVEQALPAARAALGHKP